MVDTYNVQRKYKQGHSIAFKYLTLRPGLPKEHEKLVIGYARR